MKHTYKRIFVITLITHLVLISSIFYNAAYSFAATDEDWQSISTNNDLVESFRSYCKSRDLTIEGSVLDAVTSTTSDIFFNACSSLGIDPTQLQAEIKKYTPDNLGTRWLLSSVGITAYNRIFAQLLQDYELSEGETADKIIKSGRWFSDDNGNGCWVYETAKSSLSTVYYDDLTSHGSTYLFNGVDVYNLVVANGSYTYTSVVGGQSIPLTMYKNNNTWPFYYVSGSKGNDFVYRVRLSDNAILYTGRVSALYYSYADKLYFCVQHNVYGNLTNNFVVSPIAEITGAESSDTDVKIVSPTIKPSLPEDAPIQILPDGDTSTDTTPDDGSGGSGGSGSGGTGSDTTIDVDLPNINLPDLGNINWSLSGLADKFPFCIPFDLYHFVDVLDAEPETPKFEGSINLIVTTWDLDYDLSAFDDLAAIVRNVEFIGFCIGLIFITRKIIKG